MEFKHVPSVDANIQMIKLKNYRDTVLSMRGNITESSNWALSYLRTLAKDNIRLALGFRPKGSPFDGQKWMPIET